MPPVTDDTRRQSEAGAEASLPEGLPEGPDPGRGRQSGAGPLLNHPEPQGRTTGSVLLGDRATAPRTRTRKNGRAEADPRDPVPLSHQEPDSLGPVSPLVGSRLDLSTDAFLCDLGVDLDRPCGPSTAPELARADHHSRQAAELGREEPASPEDQDALLVVLDRDMAGPAGQVREPRLEDGIATRADGRARPGRSADERSAASRLGARQEWRVLQVEGSDPTPHRDARRPKGQTRSVSRRALCGFAAWRETRVEGSVSGGFCVSGGF